MSEDRRLVERDDDDLYVVRKFPEETDDRSCYSLVLMFAEI